MSILHRHQNIKVLIMYQFSFYINFAIFTYHEHKVTNFTYMTCFSSFQAKTFLRLKHISWVAGDYVLVL